MMLTNLWMNMRINHRWLVLRKKPSLELESYKFRHSLAKMGFFSPNMTFHSTETISLPASLLLTTVEITQLSNVTKTKSTPYLRWRMRPKSERKGSKKLKSWTNISKRRKIKKLKMIWGDLSIKSSESLIPMRTISQKRQGELSRKGTWMSWRLLKRIRMNPRSLKWVWGSAQRALLSMSNKLSPSW